MTRKDYVKIASAIKSCTDIRGTDDQGAGEAYARAVANAITSPNFDRERFLIACGVAIDPEPNR